MRVRSLLNAAPALTIGLGLLAVACGGANGGGQPYGAPAAKAPPAANSIGTTTAVVGGRSETILTDSKGISLYLFVPEKDGKVVTTAALLLNWPALLLPDNAVTAVSDPALPGKLGTVTRPDGSHQVTYNEWPLYTFIGDKKPGDITGQGIGNKWFVVESVMPADADNDADGTQQPAQPTPQAQVPSAPSTPAPTFNDHDSDNSGGPSDGDGQG
jgi:predicted lipoprotein with Yx(FWY)xxD motif